MTALPQTAVAVNPVQVAAAWVRAAVGRFGLATLSEPTAAITALADVKPLAQALHRHGEWHALHAAAAECLTLGETPFARLIRDLQASAPERFLLALAGGIESDHLLTCALADLQAPERNARAGVHLAAAMVSHLFAPTSVGELLALPIFTKRALEIRGDGPLPLRDLCIDQRLWAVLAGRGASWPGAEALTYAAIDLIPTLVRVHLPAAAELLGNGLARGLVIRGVPHSGRGRVAAHLAQAINRTAMQVNVETWRDDAAFAHACRAAQWLPVLRPTMGAGESLRLSAAGRGSPVIVILGKDGAVEDADLVELELPPPTLEERARWWQERTNDAELSVQLAEGAAISGPLIDQVAISARWLAKNRGEPLARHHIAAARRTCGADALRLLAQPVDRVVPRSALVLSSVAQRDLDDFVTRCRRREALWLGLGETLACTINHGARALFVGDSGTGKTLAASYVATCLGAPLYRVDLASVMNKYVGESEKNLGRLLDLAAAVDVVLLFDEADAVFGSRNEGSETGERYANMLTNFLLTRIEQHPGIVILTANSRSRIDQAFTRRLDTIIEFPLPGPSERFALWRAHLGQRSPGDDACRWIAGHCDLPGGIVRNAVLSAAAGSGADDQPLSLPHLVRAIEREYRKMGRTMPAALATVQE